MPTLSLGVLDVAYKDDPATTTGKVAEILEGRYHIMRSFLELNEAMIGDELAKKMIARMSTPALGRRDMEIYAIDERFRDFLAADEMSKLLPPSQQSAAAQAGVNHRKKHTYAKANNARPAFVDTGQYQASFHAVLKF